MSSSFAFGGCGVACVRVGAGLRFWCLGVWLFAFGCLVLGVCFWVWCGITLGLFWFCGLVVLVSFGGFLVFEFA